MELRLVIPIWGGSSDQAGVLSFLSLRRIVIVIIQQRIKSSHDDCKWSASDRVDMHGNTFAFHAQIITIDHNDWIIMFLELFLLSSIKIMVH